MLIRVVINLGVITLANGPRLLTPLEVHGGGGGELFYCYRAAANAGSAARHLLAATGPRRAVAQPPA